MAFLFYLGFTNVYLFFDVLPSKDKNKIPDTKYPGFWWERVDSNHRSQRQQIYSLPPLATREFPPISYQANGIRRSPVYHTTNPKKSQALFIFFRFFRENGGVIMAFSAKCRRRNDCSFSCVRRCAFPKHGPPFFASMGNRMAHIVFGLLTGGFARGTAVVVDRTGGKKDG